MAITNKIIYGIDLPVYEFLRPTNLASATVANIVFTSLPSGKTPYQFAINNGGFHRYDAYADTWQQIMNPMQTTAALPTLVYNNKGFVGLVIEGRTRSIYTGVANNNKTLIGKTIRITEGTGRNQERIITDVVGPVQVYYAAGISSDTVPTTNAAFWGWTDTANNNYGSNMWRGYDVKTIRDATGSNFVRPIIGNGGNTAYINYPQFAGYPGMAGDLMSGGGLTSFGGNQQIIYQYSEVFVNEPWNVIPDNSSSYEILDTGTVFYLANINTPFSFFSYDNIVNTWYYRTVNTSRTTQFATDYVLETTFPSETPSVSSKIVSATLNQFTDTSVVCASEIYRNYKVKITDGTGKGQIRNILSAGFGVYQVDRNWETIPDSTSYYTIINPDRDLYLIGNGESRLYRYNIDLDAWFMTSQVLDYGWSKTLMIAHSGSLAREQLKYMAITNILVSTNQTISYAPGFIHGFGLSASNPTTTQTSQFIISGGGSTDGTYTLNSIGPTQATLGSSTPTFALTANTTSVVYDFEKNWTPNQWAGQLLMVYNGIQSNQLPGFSVQVIGSNTTNSLSCINAFGFTPALGSRYFILPIDRIIGRDRLEGDDPTKLAYGRFTTSVTSGTTLTDSTKNWRPSIHVGKRLAIIAGPGQGSEVTISANTANTLTVGTALTVDRTSVYVILPNYVSAAGCNLKYASNTTSSKGRYMYYHRGGNSVVLDARYDIMRETWDMANNFGPLISTGTTNTGQCFGYDYKDRIYFNLGNNTRQIFYVDLEQDILAGAGYYPYASNNQNATGLRNISLLNIDNLKFLYYARGGNNSDWFRHLVTY